MDLSHALEQLDKPVDPAVPTQLRTHVQELAYILSAQQAARTDAVAATVESLSESLLATGVDFEQVGGQIALAKQGEQARMSMESFVFATHAIHASEYGSSFHQGQMPSMESLQDGQVVVSTEGIGTMLASIGSAITKLLVRYLEEVTRSIAFSATRTTIMRAEINRLEAMLKDMGTGSKDEVRVSAKGLHFDGKVLTPDEFTKRVVENYDLLTYLLTKFQGDQVSALRRNATMADTINVSDDRAFEATFAKFVSSFKDARDQFTPKQLHQEIVGGYVLFDDGKPGYTGSDPHLRRLDEIVTKNRPVSLLRTPNSSANTAAEMPGLNKTQITTLIKAMRKSVMAIDRSRVFLESLVAGWRTGTTIVWPSLTGFPRLFSFLLSNGIIVMARAIPVVIFPGGRKYPTQVKAIKRALQYQARSLEHVYFDTAVMTLNVTGRVLRYARASIRGVEKA
jgi:hypothetical protein